MKRRDLLKLGVGLALAPGMATLPRAQDAAAAWPAKSVRLIIPFTPGGSTDFQGRILCEWLGRHFGQQFVIDHKPGAGSNIGVAEVARSAPVSMTGIFPNLLVVDNNLPVRTVKDLILLLKQQPGKYTFASSGRGTSLHLSGARVE
jgi:tripartite-type tricarboxylate transporter receptor subunit TctC